jgi:hypothetical protein
VHGESLGGNRNIVVEKHSERFTHRLPALHPLRSEFDYMNGRTKTVGFGIHNHPAGSILHSALRDATPVSETQEASFLKSTLGKLLTAMPPAEAQKSALKTPENPAAPMSLLADHPNVQFNDDRGGLGSCSEEMH